MVIVKKRLLSKTTKKEKYVYIHTHKYVEIFLYSSQLFNIFNTNAKQYIIYCELTQTSPLN